MCSRILASKLLGRYDRFRSTNPDKALPLSSSFSPNGGLGKGKNLVLVLTVSGLRAAFVLCLICARRPFPQ